MPTPSPTGYSADNIEITIASGTAVLATDYATNGDEDRKSTRLNSSHRT